jgi:hypothetical protein
MRTTRQTPGIEEQAIPPEWVKLVQQSVDSLHFGVVQIVVHNAKVVQIEKTEKLRLDPNQH